MVYPLPLAKQLLKDAINAVPAVKWALGVTGIVAALAVIAALQLNWWLALIGFLVMIVSMVILVVFARLSVSPDGALRWPVISLLWFSVVIFILGGSFLFTSVFFSWPLDIIQKVVPSKRAELTTPMPLAPRAPCSFKIGIVAPLTGTSAVFGIVVVNGIRIGLQEARAGGLACDVEQIIEDDEGDPDESRVRVAELSSKNAAVILGPMSSDCAAAAAYEAAKRKIPLISPLATASYLTDSANEWFFRANESDKRRTETLANRMTKEYPNKALLIIAEERGDKAKQRHEPLLYGEAAAADLIAHFDSAQQPYRLISFQRDRVNDDAILAEVGSLGNYAAVAILSRSADALAIGKSIRRQVRDKLIYVLSPAEAVFASEPSMDGVFAVADTLIENTDDPELLSFVSKYTVTFPGSPPHESVDRGGPFGYDAAKLVTDAVKRFWDHADDLAVKNIPLVREGIREGLERTPADRVGLMSSGGFTSSHELNIRPHLQRLKDHKWVEVPPVI